MQHKFGCWHFSSGRIRYAFTQKLGVSFNKDGEPEIGYGADGSFWMPGEKEWKEPDEVLSREDLLELAEIQIQQWQRFADWVRSSQT
jgi:hypothetical protein